ncbi:hypothetical protein [Trinickia acidisoli]|uniref:hypothetical protein n=1 Tax=Trinickia acidisoli TaxID=2767482 RepID=UPI001A8FDDAA|nr:hypothetical protein [Trinickia acidisoli]
MEWGYPKKTGDSTYEIPGHWLHIHYFEALNILFRLENSLRMFVFSVLKNAMFDNWVNIQISVEDGGPSNTISVTAKRRAGQAKGFEYLGYQVACPIMYLTGGELSRIIASEEYWRLFAGHLKGSRELIKTKLDEIGYIRNALAHFRPISGDDIEVIRQNAKQVLSPVEDYLGGMTSSTGTVPTNTDDKWYHDLQALAAVCAENDYRFVPRQDNTGDWVELAVGFSLPNIKERRDGKYRSVTTTLLWTSAIPRLFPIIGKYITRISESSIWFDAPDDDSCEIRKNCKFSFRKKVLEEHSEEIAEAFVSLIKKVVEETVLVAEDNLARGSLVRSGRCHAIWKEDAERWEGRIERLWCPVGEDDAPEYWGRLDFGFVDIVAGASRYPWMAVDVSSSTGWKM